MTTKKTDELFELVKSLTSSEKRYFKIFANRHVTNDENLYLELFNWIDEQEYYDEKLLKKAFEGSSLLKQLPVLKNYLKKNILKSLKNYTQYPSINAEVREAIEYIEILFKKRLFNQCEKLLKKALKLAEEHEHFNHLLILYNWEMKIAQELGNTAKMNDYLEHKIFEQYSILDKIKDDLLTRKVAIQFIELYEKMGKPLTSNDTTQLKGFMENNKIISAPLSHRSSRNYHIIQCIYNESIGNYEAVHHHSKALIDAYFTIYKHKISPNAYDISDALFNIIKYALFLDLHEDVEKYSHYLEEHASIIPTKEKHKKTNATHRFIESQVYIALVKMNLEQLRIYTKALEKNIQQAAKSLIPNNLLYSYTLIYKSYFVQKEYETATFWIRNITQQSKDKVPENILIQAELFQLICQFEMENEEVVISIIRSLRRKFKKQKDELSFEFQLFSKLLKIINSIEMKVIKKEFDILLNQFSKLNPMKHHEYFIIKNWLKSK